MYNEEVEGLDSQSPAHIQRIIGEWKAEYKEIYFAELDDEVFIYRLISRKEYRELLDRTDNKIDLDDLICQICVLDPIIEWGEDVYAGYSTEIARDILVKAYIVQDEQNPIDLQQEMEQLSFNIEHDFYEQVPLIIKYYFNEYSLEQIEAMSFNRQLDLFTKAKWLMENIDGRTLTYQNEQEGA